MEPEPAVLVSEDIEIEALSEDLSRFGTGKWTDGVLALDGSIYALPRDSPKVLRISPSGEITAIGPDLVGRRKYVGGVIGPDGCVYGIPDTASKVLRVDPQTLEVTHVGDDLGASQCKWAGGVCGPDGKVYGIPQSHSHVLCVDVAAQTAMIIGDGLNHVSGGPNYKWDGGVLADGCIYGMPAMANVILRIDVANQRTTTFECPSRGRGVWNYTGGVLAPDGCIYAVPCDATRVLRINVEAETAMEIGPDLTSFGEEDKWQLGVLGRDERIYCVPSIANFILRIDWQAGLVEQIGPNLVKYGPGAKWRGGVIGKNGRLYCVPSDASKVLCVSGLEHPVLLSAEDADDGIRIRNLAGDVVATLADLVLDGSTTTAQQIRTAVRELYPDKRPFTVVRQT